jgi:hypothetical protein
MGFAMVFFLLVVTAFATIEPLKEALDVNRGTSNLNCPGTPDHDAATYSNQTDFQRLVSRPTCFVTGISMVWFIFAVLLAGFTWTFKKWTR